MAEVSGSARSARAGGGVARAGEAWGGGGGRCLVLERLDELYDAWNVLGHCGPDPIIQVAREERAWLGLGLGV